MLINPKGHGVLNSIYASVAKAADLKGWDGVDLVIVGGDFQVLLELVYPFRLY